jgi:hypothetical protein
MITQSELAVMVGQCISYRAAASRAVDTYGHPEAYGYLDRFVEQIQIKLEHMIKREALKDEAAPDTVNAEG